MAAAIAGAALIVAVTTGCKMPDTGRYSSVQHEVTELTVVANQVYGRAVNYQGVTVDLKLDLYLPPAGGPTKRPTVVLVHGGGFSTGNKSQMAASARTYAQRGYIAVALGYRLDPNAGASEARYLTTALNAIDDGMEAARWLRSQATTYRIDPARIAYIGTSAGGALALGVGIHDDPTPGGPLAAYSPKIKAAVSTGAHLTPGIDNGLLTFDKTDAPALMFHFQNDTVTDATSAYAKRTCDALIAAGSKCTFVQQAGSGHTVPVAASGSGWKSHIGDFLWNELHLFAL